MSTTNRHPETGIRYGMIALDSLVDLWGELEALPNPGLDEQLGEYARDQIKKLAMKGDLEPADLDRDEDSLDDDAWFEAIYELADDDAREILDRVDPSALQEFWDGCESTLIGREGEIEGVKVRITELGGALHLWVFESPHTGVYELCSPCVPGAVNLDQPDPLGELGYDVPPSWRATDV